MDNSRTAHQATHWELKGYKRKSGRPRKNWVDVIKRDLRQMDLTWEEPEELAWPNAAIWMRDELRSKGSNMQCTMAHFDRPYARQFSSSAVSRSLNYN